MLLFLFFNQELLSKFSPIDGEHTRKHKTPNSQSDQGSCRYSKLQESLPAEHRSGQTWREFNKDFSAVCVESDILLHNFIILT